MTYLHSYMDNPRRGIWANVRMENGAPCFISVSQQGVLVRKSKFGFRGAKLYEGDNVHKAAEAAMTLALLYPEDLTPPEMSNPILQAFTNAVLHCKTLEEVTFILNVKAKEVR